MRNTVLFLVLTVTMAVGRKLDGWQDPEISGTINRDAEMNARRNPKLFWGTTTTTTATLSTTTACYLTVNNPTTACSKKKRSIDDLPGEENSRDLILPSSTWPSDPEAEENSQSARQSKAVDLNQAVSALSASPQSKTEPRFILFYWFTSTVTTTSTTFTKTTTFSITGCTPAGSFVYSACG